MIPVRSLLRRRSPQVAALRRALGEERRLRPSSELVRAAEDLLARKLELARRVGEVTSCSRCAVGMDDKAGTFDGGLCCSGNAADVFAPESIAALAITGTEPSDWRAATDSPEDQRGCVFRSGRGCTIAVRHRPSLCVHYICEALMGELAGAGRSRRVAAAQDELAASMRRFAERFENERADAEVEALYREAISSESRR